MKHLANKKMINVVNAFGFSLAILAPTWGLQVHADDVQLTGTATSILSGKCGRGDSVKGKKDKQIYADTFAKAKENAIRGYVANNSIAMANAFETKKQEIFNNIDDYLSIRAPRVFCDRGTKFLEFVVTGTLNKGKFDLTLALDQSRVAERSRLTSIFVARRQAKVQAFDQRRTDVDKSKEVVEVMQSAELNSDNSATSSGTDVQMRSVAVGGNVESKSDNIEYESFRPDGLDAATSEIFVSLGYRPIQSAQVVRATKGRFNVSRFEEEYASEADITDEAISDAFEAISDKNIPLLLIARLDVGAPVRARGNENPTVIVDVNAQVYRYEGEFYEIVASYGPEQKKSTGLTATQAENNAILQAARSAARQLGAQLQQNNVF